MNSETQQFDLIQLEKFLVGVLYQKPWYVKHFSFHDKDFSSAEYRKMYQVIAENENLTTGELIPVLLGSGVSAITLGSFAANAESHVLCPPKEYVQMAEIVRENMLKSELERRIKSSGKVMDAIEYANELNALRSNYEVQTFGEVFSEYYDSYLEDQEKIRSGVSTFVKTGMSQFDIKVHMEPSELVILAARTSIGKTMFALWCAVQAALRGQKVAFINLEMSKKQIMNRILAILNAKPIIDFKFCRADINDSVMALDKLKNNLLLVNTGGIKSTYVRKLLMSKGLIDLVILDYINLLTDRADSLQVKLGDISNNLKTYAKERNCVIMALCQLNRESEKQNREPDLADIKDSSGIEQAADTVIMLHKDDRKTDDVKLLVRKQRNGQRSEIDYAFDSTQTKYREQQPIFK